LGSLGSISDQVSSGERIRHEVSCVSGESEAAALTAVDVMRTAIREATEQR